MDQVPRLPRACMDCNAELPEPAAQRKRCESCAYTARISYNREWRRRRTATAEPKPCDECGEQFDRGERRLAKYCGTCRKAKARENKRNYLARNPAPTKPKSRPCRTCGAPVPRSGKVYAFHCSDKCKPRCKAPECVDAFKYRTEIGLLCVRHYTLWKTHGRLHTIQRYERADPGRCRQCGLPMDAPVYGQGWLCSARCFGRRRDGIDEAETWQCAKCPAVIERRRTRRDAKLCGLCRRSQRPSLTAHQVADRDGIDCGICGDPVDMTLPGNAYWGPTVDHKMPRSRGGSNGPGNLQLAHRICNCRKLDKIL